MSNAKLNSYSPALRSVDAIFAPIGGANCSCTHNEYHVLGALVRAMSSCRMLIFGVGRDTAAWIEVNEGGECRFLENDETWISQVSKKVPLAKIDAIHYPLDFDQWTAGARSLGPELLPLVEDFSFEPFWDVIFVDGPWGSTFGRQQSAYAATQAVRRGGLLAIHDCNREREQIICTEVIEAEGLELVVQVEKLRIYQRGR